MADTTAGDETSLRAEFTATARCNGAAARRAARYLSAVYDRMLAPSGLRVTQFSILSALAVAGPASITVLAETIALDRTTLATNLKPLEREGLLTVRTAEHDRRAREVAITDSGVATLRAALPLWRAAQERFEDAYGADEARTLRRDLRRVLDTGLDPWAERH